MSDSEATYVTSCPSSPAPYTLGQPLSEVSRLAEVGYAMPGPSQLHFATSSCRDLPVPDPRHTDASPSHLHAELLSPAMPAHVRDSLRTRLVQLEERLARPPPALPQHAVYAQVEMLSREVEPGVLADGRMIINHPRVKAYVDLIGAHGPIIQPEPLSQGTRKQRAGTLYVPTVSIDEVGRILGTPDLPEIEARSIVALAAISVLHQREHSAHKVLWARDPSNMQIKWMNKLINSVLRAPQPTIWEYYSPLGSSGVVDRLLWTRAAAAPTDPVAGRTRSKKNAVIAPAVPAAPKQVREKKLKVVQEPVKDRMRTRRRARTEAEQGLIPQETTVVTDEPSIRPTPIAEAIVTSSSEGPVLAIPIEDNATVDIETVDMPPPPPPAPRRSARMANKRDLSTPIPSSASNTPAPPRPIRPLPRQARSNSDATVVQSPSEETVVGFRLDKDAEALNVDIVKVEADDSAALPTKRKETNGKNKRERDLDDEVQTPDAEIEECAPAKRARKITKKAQQSHEQKASAPKAKRSRARK